jgi:ParB/RepB/Spo0J family partition protein
MASTTLQPTSNSAVSTAISNETNPTTTILLDIAVSDIVADPNNQYRPTTKAFEDNIAAQGVLEPVLVCRREDGKYDLIAGERRWRAATKVGHATIPAVVRELTAQQRVVIQTIENLMRVDLSFTQGAVQCGRALDLGMTRAELAKTIGQKPGWVAARLKILNAPTVLWPFIDNGGLSLDELDAIKPHYDNVEVIDQLVTNLKSDRPTGRPGWFCDETAKRATALIERERLVAELTAANIVVVEWNGDKTTGYTTLSALGFDRPDIKKHTKEACHGACVVTSWDQKVNVVGVCVDPKRHTTKGASPVKTAGGTTRTAADEDRLGKQRRLRECAIQRDDAALRLLGDGLNQRDTIELLSAHVIATMSNDTARLVGKQLGLQTPEMTGYQPWSTIVEQHIATGGIKEAQKVARLAAYHHAVNAWNKELRQHVSTVLYAKGWEPLHSDDPLADVNANTETGPDANTANDADGGLDDLDDKEGEVE